MLKLVKKLTGASKDSSSYEHLRNLIKSAQSTPEFHQTIVGTADFAQEILSSLRFSGGLGMWSPQIFIQPDPNRDHPMYKLITIFHVPDRNSLGSRAESIAAIGAHFANQIELGSTLDVRQEDLIQLPQTLRQFLSIVYSCIHRLAMHELREGFLVAGQRIYDPHGALQ